MKLSLSKDVTPIIGVPCEIKEDYIPRAVLDSNLCTIEAEHDKSNLEEMAGNNTSKLCLVLKIKPDK